MQVPTVPVYNSRGLEIKGQVGGDNFEVLPHPPENGRWRVAGRHPDAYGLLFKNVTDPVTGRTSHRVIIESDREVEDDLKLELIGPNRRVESRTNLKICVKEPA